MEREYRLSDVKPGETAIIEKLLLTGGIRRRFLDIGLIENTKVRCVGKSPAGDPFAFLIRGAVIAIRLDDCNNILVSDISGYKEGRDGTGK